MGRKKKVPFNHEVGNTAVACGIDENVIDAKYEEFANDINNRDGISNSRLIEELENNFNKRELSYILAFKLRGECCQAPDPLSELLGGGMPRRSGNPMEALLALAALSKLKSELEA